MATTNPINTYTFKVEIPTFEFKVDVFVEEFDAQAFTKDIAHKIGPRLSSLDGDCMDATLDALNWDEEVMGKSPELNRAKTGQLPKATVTYTTDEESDCLDLAILRDKQEKEAASSKEEAAA